MGVDHFAKTNKQLARELFGLKPCVVFHDIGPGELAAIRAAAEPRPPAARIDVHPYYLERIDPATEEAAHATRQQLQDYLDEAMRAYVLEGMATEAEQMRRLHLDGEL